ncbi:MAG: regulatory protein RecX [Clostridia bacterium]|nr:regulatory protein RecX [Clostridia bacterium]
MILITVTEVNQAENSRGKFLITVKLSTGQHEEVRTFSVFRYFLKNPIFGGDVPKVGDFLSSEKFEALEFAETCSNAAIRAVNFLAYGDNTAKKLSEKLRQKGFSRDAAAEAVRFCVEKRYINEEDQLRRLMELLCEKKKYGLRRIRQEVYNKGFSEDTVKAVFEECAAELDFDAAVTDRVRRLGADAFSSPEKKKKQVSSLLRYGFSMDEINRALKAVHAGELSLSEDSDYDE